MAQNRDLTLLNSLQSRQVSWLIEEAERDELVEPQILWTAITERFNEYFLKVNTRSYPSRRPGGSPYTLAELQEAYLNLAYHPSYYAIRKPTTNSYQQLTANSLPANNPQVPYGQQTIQTSGQLQPQNYNISIWNRLMNQQPQRDRFTRPALSPGSYAFPIGARDIHSISPMHPNLQQNHYSASPSLLLNSSRPLIQPMPSMPAASTPLIHMVNSNPLIPSIPLVPEISSTSSINFGGQVPFNSTGPRDFRGRYQAQPQYPLNYPSNSPTQTGFRQPLTPPTVVQSDTSRTSSAVTPIPNTPILESQSRYSKMELKNLQSQKRPTETRPEDTHQEPESKRQNVEMIYYEPTETLLPKGKGDLHEQPLVFRPSLVESVKLHIGDSSTTNAVAQVFDPVSMISGSDFEGLPSLDAPSFKDGSGSGNNLETQVSVNSTPLDATSFNAGFGFASGNNFEQAPSFNYCSGSDMPVSDDEFYNRNFSASRSVVGDTQTSVPISTDQSHNINSSAPHNIVGDTQTSMPVSADEFYNRNFSVSRSVASDTQTSVPAFGNPSYLPTYVDHAPHPDTWIDPCVECQGYDLYAPDPCMTCYTIVRPQWATHKVRDANAPYVLARAASGPKKICQSAGVLYCVQDQNRAKFCVSCQQRI